MGQIFKRDLEIEAEVPVVMGKFHTVLAIWDIRSRIRRLHQHNFFLFSL